ncbi:ribonuclease III domain-containing protein [Massariosphaeria phaeospora]|uniref:Ribonuclease III domain-containing protein n=1 Tax=Massariosphaeria phaeospora TaxID=100035 RepID=A0A7C8I9Z8_9PLEO|nr:ribonuclease III domain-containing protein [Massariosphaeria phaeospora]
MNANENIAMAEQILAYTFNDKLLCAEALQMAAPTTFLVVNNNFEGVKNNKRLAVLGDVALAQALCKMWYQATDGAGQLQPPGAWTELRNDILGNANLSRVGESLGLGRIIVMSEGNGGHASPRMLATTVEAMAGAVY